MRYGLTALGAALVTLALVALVVVAFDWIVQSETDKPGDRMCAMTYSP